MQKPAHPFPGNTQITGLFHLFHWLPSGILVSNTMHPANISKRIPVYGFNLSGNLIRFSHRLITAAADSNA